MVIGYLRFGKKKEFFGIFSSKEIAQSKYKKYLEDIKLCKIQLEENIKLNQNLSVDNIRDKFIENLKTSMNDDMARKIYINITVNKDYGINDLLSYFEKNFKMVYNDSIKELIITFFNKNRKVRKLIYPIRTNFPKGKTKLELEEIQLDDYIKPKLH